MSTRSFSVYDFFVDIIPGSLALLLMISLLPADYTAIDWITEMGIFEGTLFLLVSYILGHFVQSIASPIDSWWMERKFQVWKIVKEDQLYPFENLLDRARDDENYVVVNQFLNRKGDFFEDNLSGVELFSVTQSYLWNHNIGRMRRFQVLYTFFRSLWILFLLGAGLYLIAILGAWWELYTTVWSFGELMIICVLLGVSAVLAYFRRVKLHSEMAKAMVFDFYANVFSQND